MARQYRPTLVRRLANQLMTAALKLGLGPRTLRLLTVTGRKSGKRYTTPVNLVERDGSWYLVAPYGEVSWVRNARVAGEVTLSRGRTSQVRRIEPLAAAESVPVLKDYWHRNAITRQYFEAQSAEDSDTLLKEANRHPVFRLH